MADASSSSSSSSASFSDELRLALPEITGTEAPIGNNGPDDDVSTVTRSDDDITPFASPMLSATQDSLETMSDMSIEEDVDPNRIPTEEEKAKSLEFKVKANKAFGDQNYQESISLFTFAIRLDPHSTILYSNRAMVKMKLEEYGSAVSDCTRAIELDAKNVKAFYRRALSHLSILKPTLAVPDFKQVLLLDPRNTQAREQLTSTIKLIRRIEFEKAISVGETETASAKVLAQIKDNAVPLDTGYKGPMPEWVEETGRYKPTMEFVEGTVELFKNGGKLPRRLVWEIVLGCKEVLDKEGSLVEVDVPEGKTCDVVGDTHGQFYDLVNLLSLLGPPSENHMIVFNGDFVDRGSWSVEVALTLFAYKWLLPKSIFLNRGNHETSDMNKVYGFEGECKAKHGEMTYKLFADVFTSLPMATLLSASLDPSNFKSEGSQPAILSPKGRKRYFIVHGGLFSQDGVTLDDIKKIDRYGRQPGQSGLMCEMLWTDPQDANGRGPSKRGVGVGFGPDVTRRWLEANQVTAVIRSHEVRQEGYAIEHDGLCLTVFSAPHYCDAQDNKAAYIKVQPDGQLSYHQYDAVPHPPMRPMAYAGGFGGMM